MLCPRILWTSNFWVRIAVSLEVCELLVRLIFTGISAAKTTTRRSAVVTCSYVRLFTAACKMSRKESVYGSWASPISSKLVSESSVSFQEVNVDWDSSFKDTVYWTELRYDQNGRYFVCSQKVGEEGFKTWTSGEFNARTRVHEYGGGASFICKGTLYFTNFSDQKMFKQTSCDAAPEAFTADKEWRYADGQYSVATGRIYCVREDHTGVATKEVKEAVNTIVTINPADGSQNILASGANFYSSPRVSPNGKQIAWVQWNHPNMPWDSTELWVADLTADGVGLEPGSSKKVASGTDLSVMLPSWTHTNNLLYIGDQTDWWNLYLVTSTGEHVNLMERQVELGGPHWVFGSRPYALDPRENGDIATAFGKELGVLNMKTRDYRILDTGFSSHSNLKMTGDGNIYCIASSPTRFPCVIRVNSGTGKVDIIRESKTSDLDTGYFSIPSEIEWKTGGGETSHGFYYPPTNKDFTAPAGTLPPLLVKNHGGPTAQSGNALNLKNQYFTSRGFAVLDVNYRGSTGYGKKYRHKMRGKQIKLYACYSWGVVDVEDACSGAQHLADTGKVNGKALCIDGGSAGGYVTLACLTFRDTFQAGASHYGIGDLSALAEDTHKFESRYFDNILAPYTEENKKLYHERSPINYIDKLNCAMALFQGSEDEIVPPNQAEMMYKAVKAKGLPTLYVLFEGEQHGFRKSENVQMALDGEFYFYSKVFGFQSADTHFSVEIDNLKA